jgi:pimeloyl-ACP methyl ester carboxylesterase
MSEMILRRALLGSPLAARASSVLSYAGGVVTTPAVWVARRLLDPPMLPHAIVAPRRVLRSPSLGRLSYYEDDSGGGLPLLLLHDVGPTASSRDLRGIFDVMRGERPVIAADLPGYGFSERRPEGFRREDLVAYVEELARDVSRRYGATVDIVAIGTTGELAASAVVRSSRHVRSLAILSPMGLVPPRWLARAGRRLAHRPLAIALLHATLASRPALRLGRRDERSTQYTSAAARQPHARVATAAALAGTLSSPDALEIYAALRVPTCFVHGEDASSEARAIDALRTGRPILRRSEIADVRRSPHLERPDATASALIAFWRTLAVKPELRVIRGERASREAPLARRRAGRGSTTPRSRTWR